MLVVKNLESLSRLWVVVFDVALVLFVEELRIAAGLAHVLLIECYARKRVDVTSVIGRGGKCFGEGFGEW